MNTQDNGGPAFPVDRLTAHGIAIHEIDPANEKAYIKRVAELSHGVSVRDYFAGQALTGMLAEPNLKAMPDEFARRSYALADAMLEARKA